jgi:hypothetical protein
VAKKKKSFVGNNNPIDTSIRVTPLEQFNMTDPNVVGGQPQQIGQPPPTTLQPLTVGSVDAPRPTSIPVNPGQPPGSFVGQPADGTQVNTGTAVPPPGFDLREELNKLKAQGFFQGGDVLGNLSPNIGEGIEQNISSLVGGGAGADMRSASNEAFARGAKHLRSRAAGAVSGLGQGDAVQSQQGVEQAILGGASENILRQNVADQQLRMEGARLGLNLAQVNEQSKQFGQNLQLAFTGMAGDQQNLLTNLTANQQNLLTKLDFDKAINSENLASQMERMGMNIASAEKLAADKNYLLQQGIDLDTARLKGYRDPVTGEWVMGSQQLATIQATALMNSQAGKGFHDYLAINLDADLSDPAVQQLGQGLWESLGNTGEAPRDWVKARILAARDPRLTNVIVGTEHLLSQALQSGAITQEQFDDAMDNFVNGVIDPDVEDDKDVPAKETFTIWKGEQVPSDFGGDISQKDWEDAGKPDSWEEYVVNVVKNIDTEGDLVSDGKLIITKKELAQIGDAINAGSEEIQGEYGVPEDSLFYDHFINQSDLSGSERRETERNAKENIGKIIKTPDGSFMVLSVGMDPISTRVKVINTDTGKTETISWT